jgi:hypothetical protein
LLNSQKKINEPLHGKGLLKHLADNIVQRNSDTLHKLAPYTYQKEIDELQPTFKVVSFSEMTGYGGYHGNGPLIEVILHNSTMLSNLNVQFLATISGNTIYSRDSVIRDYKKLVERVQSIEFITKYFKANPSETLDILYFNNHPINQYNIDGVNKNPEEWKKQDAYIKSLDWYKENNQTPSFNVSEAIKISERLNCGCNYRFPNEFIQKAICFIIDDKEKNHSRWLLLPDNTVLLYLMQGERVLNYSYSDFGEYPGVQYPCIRFDSTGKIIPKKE